MDFKDIQSAWNNDKSDNVVLPKNLEKLQSVNMPLSQIKKYLKRESYLQILIIVCGFVPVFVRFNPIYLFIFYLVYSISVIVSGYFLLKIFYFYKIVNNKRISTKDNLYETYYEIKLFMEVYKIISTVSIPFGFIYLIIIPLGSKTDKVIKIVESLKNPEFLYVGLIIVFVLWVISCWLLIKAHAEMFYGKYAKEVKRVIDELKEE
jgi:hypothetical protein